jgi:hypothetical protein
VDEGRGQPDGLPQVDTQQIDARLTLMAVERIRVLSQEGCLRRTSRVPRVTVTSNATSVNVERYMLDRG